MPLACSSRRKSSRSTRERPRRSIDHAATMSTSRRATALSIRSRSGRLSRPLAHGLAIEPAGDLLGGGDGKLVAGDLNEAADFELILEQFAFRLGALQDGIGLAD
jgi:hypothetical protein